MEQVLKWLIVRVLDAGATGVLLAAIILAGVLLAGCQAHVGEGNLKDADLSILCGSSSNRLLPECKEFSR